MTDHADRFIQMTKEGQDNLMKNTSPQPPITGPQQCGRAARVEQWLYVRMGMGARITLTDVRRIAEYTLGYSDVEPWTEAALADAPWLDAMRKGQKS